MTWLLIFLMTHASALHLATGIHTYTGGKCGKYERPHGIPKSNKKTLKITLSSNLASQHSATLIMIHFPTGSIVTSAHKAYAGGTCLIKPKLARTEASSIFPSSPGHTTTLPNADARCLSSASSLKASEEHAHGHKHTHSCVRRVGLNSKNVFFYRILTVFFLHYSFQSFRVEGIKIQQSNIVHFFDGFNACRGICKMGQVSWNAVVCKMVQHWFRRRSSHHCSHSPICQAK